MKLAIGLLLVSFVAMTYAQFQCQTDAECAHHCLLKLGHHCSYGTCNCFHVPIQLGGGGTCHCPVSLVDLLGGGGVGRRQTCAEHGACTCADGTPGHCDHAGVCHCHH